MDVGALINNSITKPSGTTESAQAAQENQDRFLKLLVAQMKNQDPMNPMQNAELTTQIAQIQTVTGIDKLNTSIEALGTQFSNSSGMSAVGMVGRSVMLEGNRLLMGAEAAQGAFGLDSAADNVTVEIVTAAGTVVDTVQLGAASAGKHTFTWSQEGYSPDTQLFARIEARRGATVIKSNAFARDQVVALNTANGQLKFELASGKEAGFADFISVD
jgi:flagellar basal-body rod modification protein FlgD